MRLISKLDYGRYVGTKTRCRIRHFLRIRFPKRASIVFIGGYYGENTGDWAMGEALVAEASRRGITSRRLAMRDSWRLRDMHGSLVVGGGAVATAEALEPIAIEW